MSTKMGCLYPKVEFSVLPGRVFVSLFEIVIEVGSIPETTLITDIAYSQIRILQQGPGIFETLALQPFSRGLLEVRLKISLKGGKAPATQPCIFFQLQVVMEVLVHDRLQVDFLRPFQGVKIG